ncbi:hypothetical protein [Mesorhizobium escarrei]|uniref:hypothetical protein n=1 Tax=Mesorhizobium escarrei TaxID=666018 RepID=UPI0020A72562|nr:hypothetical protein [Mesorhizobium escarrei]
MNGEGEDKVTWFFTVELVRVLGALADALRRGDDPRFTRTMAKLAGLDSLALRTFNDDALCWLRFCTKWQGFRPIVCGIFALSRSGDVILGRS